MTNAQRGPYRMHAPDAVPCTSFQSIAGREYACQRQQSRARKQHAAHRYKARAKDYAIEITWHEIMPHPPEPERKDRTMSDRTAR
jgi:hypothetical protein